MIEDIVSEEYQAAKNRRREVVDQIMQIDSDMIDRNKLDENGNRMDDKTYWKWKHENGIKKFQLQRESTKLKNWLHDNDKPPHVIRIRKDPILASTPGTLTEFDLQNALAEPNNLVRLAYDSLKRLTSQVGRTEQHRGLLDAMEDYLRRQAILI